MVSRKKILVNYIAYFFILILSGYIVSYLSKEVERFNHVSSFTWFIIILSLTFGFKPIRDTILPLLNIQPFQKVTTYLYILFVLVISYFTYKICFTYEIFLDPTLILFYKNGWLTEASWTSLLDVITFVPVWEEILFRGVLLFTLLKFVKPFWAIVIVSIIFGLFHPTYWVTAGIMGVLLSMLTLKTKSLCPAMVSHSLWNLYAGKLFLYF